MDHRRIAVDSREEGRALVDHADVVEGDPGTRLELAREREALLEVLERGPRVAVVRTEARQVDVAEIERSVGLDQDHAVAARMAGRGDRAHAHAAAQLEYALAGEAARVGSRRVVELLEQRAAPRPRDRRGEAVDREHAVDRAQPDPIRFVDVDGSLGKQRQPRDVILVTVREQHVVDARQPALTRPQAERGIDEQALVRTGDEQAVAVGILSAARPEQDRRRAHPARLECERFRHARQCTLARGGSLPLSEELIAQLQKTTEGMFPGLLGVRFASVAKDCVVAELLVRSDFCTLPGRAHGGVLMAFADTLGAYGTFINLPAGASTTTIESKTNFFAAGAEGSVLRGESTPLHIGRRTMVWQTRITSGDALVALVTQTQMVLPAT